MKKLTIKKSVKSLVVKSSTLTRETLKDFKGGVNLQTGIETGLEPEGGCNSDSICASGRSIWNNFSGKPHTNCCA
ncbi:hypothetical protein B0A69_01120 [Chryseobacterium shigense]|uniref:hypothetical protein n=1 Tax=Chryseobacterium shigense TaxID=297244 RepID=UPI0009708130|nr:hypothetical protein [Chryseobacterium shigense]PQA96706.1 hypothetical protein B0A69_01120 [Chryseobacterium shigense]